MATRILKKYPPEPIYRLHERAEKAEAAAEAAMASVGSISEALARVEEKLAGLNKALGKPRTGRKPGPKPGKKRGRKPGRPKKTTE